MVDKGKLVDKLLIIITIIDITNSIQLVYSANRMVIKLFNR